MTTDRTEDPDYLTRIHFSILALVAEDRRDDAAALGETLSASEQAAMWARSLDDTLLLATGLARHLGIDFEGIPAWLRSFGHEDEEVC
ncbi:hypothetical protein [Gordonia hongkongensis]|uniref:hypothetical protein n=1 Tax=Gordonia hongkongensis TaxID=1701090 RepID=UPI003D7534A9